MKKELEWKWINGFEGLYKIYIDGSVYSVRTNRMRKYELSNAGTGYYQIGLWKNNKRKQVLIHRLIAEHFIENPNNHKEVDHINRNSKDNRIENLRWCDRKMNVGNTIRNRKNKNNSTGITGVCWNKNSKKWYARIGFNYEMLYIGSFNSKQKAIYARKKYENKISKIKKNTKTVL